MLQLSFGSSLVAITMLLTSIPRFIRKLKSHSSLVVTADAEAAVLDEVEGTTVEEGGVASGTVIGESVDEIDDLDDNFD